MDSGPSCPSRKTRVRNDGALGVAGENLRLDSHLRRAGGIRGTGRGIFRVQERKRCAGSAPLIEKWKPT